MKKHGNEIAKDTLALSLENITPPEQSFSKKLNINEHQVQIGVEKVIS